MPTTAYFKLQILSTFVHEVAHHFDHTRRVARGRWLAQEKEKIEHFALHRQYEWTQACEWLEVHGTIRFTLGEPIPDPRRVYPTNQPFGQAIELRGEFENRRHV